MKALYEVIVKTDGPGISVHTDIIEFESCESFAQFKQDMYEYEKVGEMQVWRSVKNV